ncbi:MAG: hypothetical protein M1335_03440, partial [Chloroflexi bacterium]|nr:hypothetical protein [Chloroflexota bacterium]
DVEVKIKTTPELAGKKAVIQIGRLLNGVTYAMSATVNFTSSDSEEPGAANLYFGNPYLVNPPHTPTVDEIGFVGVQSGGGTVELSDVTDYPTNGHYIIAIDGSRTAVTNMRLKAIVTDPDMINLTAAEFFQSDTQPAPVDYGTGTAMTAEDGSFDSPEETVIYNIPSSTIDAMAEQQFKYWVHGKNADNTWGTFGSTFMSVDRTVPTAAVTKPVAGEFVGRTYRSEGDSNWNNAGGTYRAPMNSVQIYDEGTDDFTDLAENDSGRGGINFSKWYYMWDTTFSAGEQYAFRARALDGAGRFI